MISSTFAVEWIRLVTACSFFENASFALMGAVGEGKNIAHQQKKMPGEALRQFRDRFNIPIPDDKLGDIPYYKPAADSPEVKYLQEIAAKRGGSIPQRRRKSVSLAVPKLDTFKTLLEATAEGREISTTMAFVRMLTALVRDKTIGRNVVPIVPDESRTFGMEGLFRQLGIYSSLGQLYEPEDSDQLMPASSTTEVAIRMAFWVPFSLSQMARSWMMSCFRYSDISWPHADAEKKFKP